jgi:hypothetical protein
MGKPLQFRIPAYRAAIMVNAVIFNIVALTFAYAQDSKPVSKEPKLGKQDAKAVTLTGSVVDQNDRPASASVHIQNPYVEIDVTLQTDPNGKFETIVRMEDSRVEQLQIVATAKNGSLLGFYHAASNGEDDRAIKIKLEPSTLAKVKVVGADGKPIEAANVAMQLGYPYTLSPALTDAEGMVELKLPASEKILAVVAWKDHFGLDYKLYTLPRGQDKDQLTKPPTFPIDSGEQLVLEGASPLTVRIVDTNDKPIPEMGAHVWLLRNENAAEELNLSFFTRSFNEQANADGNVVFNWFPSWQKGTTSVWPSAIGKSAQGFVHTRGNYEPANDNGSLKMVLERLIPIRGTVTFPDGKPAEGIAVGASGAGYTWDGFHGSVLTDEAGRYEIMATPNQIYMLYVADKQWSAPAQSGFAVMPDKEVEPHDFVLRPATRVFGRVLDKATQEPQTQQLIYFSQQGTALNDIGKDILPNPEKSTTWVCPMWQQNAQTAEDGKYEFYAGPGEYNLFIQGKEAIKFTITDEKEKQVDLPIEVDPVKLLTGLTVDSRTKKPVSGARIEVVSQVLTRFNDWKANSNTDGKFQLKVFKEASYVHAVSPDAKLGTITELDADRTTMILSLVELGSARGKLMTQDGSQVSAGTKLMYGVTIKDSKSGLSSNRFGSVVTTDKNGEFKLTGLVPGRKYECTLFDHPGGYVLQVASVTVEPGETKQLGELKTPEEPKPYVPPTLEDRTREAFNVAGKPLERFEKAKSLVKQVNQNLLIVLASPEDERAKELMRLRYESQEFRSYVDDFRFMAISTADDKLEAAQTLAKALDVSLEPGNAFMLVVVDHEGKVAGKLTSAQICDGELLSKGRLLAELDKFKTVPLDAHELLQKAYEQAEREGKQIFLQETATWCGPCQMLSRLLLQNRQWEKDYVWVKMDHRWTGAMEIMKELRGDAEGGIPWMVILDSQGNKLATSNIPESGANIGFPSEPEAQVHFANMLKATRQRMTDKEIDDLITATSKP